jgi:DNA-binding LytR/AlgR family response regulator
MQPVIKYICIDDDPLEHMVINDFASMYSEFEHKGNFLHPMEGLQAVIDLNPDLIFADIDMPGMSGIELVKKINRHENLVVFFTSHPEFALEGFELEAFDYILKPMTEQKFDRLVKKVRDFLQLKQKAKAYDFIVEQEAITFKEGHSYIKLPMHEIIYLEAMQDYTKIITPKKNYLTLTTFSSLMEKLPNDQFLRIHRSYAVALDKVNRLKNNELICGEVTLPIGKTYRNAVSQIKL